MNRGEVTKDDYADKPQVAQYLNRASRGVWGRERTRLRDELSIHIDGLVNSYRMAGTPLDEAVDKALLEMGPATKVSVGIARLNALPLMSVMGLLACAVIAVTTMLASTVAQSITPLDTSPIEECIADGGTTWYCRAEDWVGTDELVLLLEQQNIDVNEVGDNLFITVPGYDKVLVRIGPISYTIYSDKAPAGVDLSTETGYLQIRGLLEALAIKGIPVSLEGWDTLTIDIADKSFDILFTDVYNAQTFYADTFGWTLANLAPAPGTYRVNTTKRDLATKPYSFDIDAQEGEVYGVFVALNEETLAVLSSGVVHGHKHEKDTAAFYYDLARVEADGELVLNLPDMEDIEFRPAAMKVVGNGRALLVRLTGEVGKGLYTVIPPEEVGLESQ